LLSIPLPEGRYPSRQFSPQQHRQKTLETLLSFTLAQAEQQPVLFILEDLHWTDPSTLAWLDLLIEQCPTVSILTLLTCRPEFQPPWGAGSYLTPLTLQRFTRGQVETMVQRVTGGKTLPAEVMQHLAEKSDGVPLYVEEMTKAILESGVLHESDGHYALTGPLTSLTIPTTLQDSLTARLDRLVHHPIKEGWKFLRLIRCRQFSIPYLRYAVLRLGQGPRATRVCFINTPPVVT
jgi:predicted ATPase